MVESLGDGRPQGHEILEAICTLTHLVLDLETAHEPGGQEEDALSPARGRITCICVKGEDVEKTFCYADEKKLLDQFWKFIDSYNTPPTFVTYNGDGFDFLFLKLKTVKHGLRPLWIRCLDSRDNIDLSLKLYGYKKRESKDDVCKCWGIDGLTTEFTGRDMPRLWHEGKTDIVIAHCLDDVRRQWTMFQRMREAGVV